MEYILKNKWCQGKLCDKAASNKGVMRGAEICHSKKDNLANTLYSCQKRTETTHSLFSRLATPFYKTQSFLQAVQGSYFICSFPGSAEVSVGAR